MGATKGNVVMGLKGMTLVSAFLCLLLLAGCAGAPAGNAAVSPQGSEPSQPTDAEGTPAPEQSQDTAAPYTADTPISQVIEDPVFDGYGRLIFPVDTGYYSGDTLGELRLTWYNNIDPEETVAIVNDLHDRAQAGEPCSTTYTLKRKKRRTRARRTPDCSSFGGKRALPLPCATRAADLPMWGPCRTAFPTRWSCPGGATTPLP